MTAMRVRLFRGTYADSVVQLAGTQAMRTIEGIEWAAVGMATRASLDTLAGQGFDPRDWSGSGVNDLVIAVRATSDEIIDQAERAGRAAIVNSHSAGPAVASGTGPGAEAATADPAGGDDTGARLVRLASERWRR